MGHPRTVHLRYALILDGDKVAMPLYFVLVHIESPIDPDTEDAVTNTMSKFGFGKTATTDDDFKIPLPPWLYSGFSDEDDVAVSRRLRSMLHLAVQKELTVIVMPGEPFHLAHTQGSMLGIGDLDPDDQ
jgi:hypothetical protein